MMYGNFVLNLKKKLHGSPRKVQNKNIHSLSFMSDLKNLKLSECTIEDIMPHLLVCSSFASISSREKMWVATSMLVRFLETNTNNLVVMECVTPVAMLGGKEAVRGFSRNPSHHFFLDVMVDKIMSRDLYIASPRTKIYDLLDRMRRINRDFALVQDGDDIFSSVSARRLLEVGLLCDTQLKVSDMQKNEIYTIMREATIGEIISIMIMYDSEFLTLENTPKYVTPQTVFEKVVELNYLEGIDNFLELKATALNLKNGKIISENTSLPDLCNTMLGMKNPFVMTSNNVLTPWDLMMALG